VAQQRRGLEIGDWITADGPVEKRIHCMRERGHQHGVPVWAERATASVPMLPPAPGLFSTTA
jgi:hypothetical protein